MPGMDGTGPAGAGRMTGWGMGPCGNDGSADYSGYPMRGMVFGRGMGMRCGLGLGRRHGMGVGRGFGLGYGPSFRAFGAAGTGVDEEGLKEVLMDQKNFLKARLDAIDKRLETL